MDGKDFMDFSNNAVEDKGLQALAKFASLRLVNFMKERMPKDAKAEDIEIVGDILFNEFMESVNMYFMDEFLEWSWDTEGYEGTKKEIKRMKFDNEPDTKEIEKNFNEQDIEWNEDDNMPTI